MMRGCAGLNAPGQRRSPSGDVVHENLGSLHFQKSWSSRAVDGHRRRHDRCCRRRGSAGTRRGVSGHRRTGRSGAGSHGPAHRRHRDQPHDLPTGACTGKRRRLCRRDGKARQGNAGPPAEDRLDGRCRGGEAARWRARIAGALFRRYPGHGGRCRLAPMPSRARRRRRSCFWPLPSSVSSRVCCSARCSPAPASSARSSF